MGNRICILFLILILIIGCQSTKTVDININEIVYSGLENEISFDSNNCMDLYIKITNGYCKCVQNGKAIIKPDSIGKVIVDIINPNKKQTRYIFISKQVPRPVAYFDMGSAHFPTPLFGIRLDNFKFAKTVLYRLISFLAYYDNGEYLESEMYFGRLFYGELFNRANEMVDGRGIYNKIIFDSIVFEYPDGSIGMADKMILEKKL